MGKIFGKQSDKGLVPKIYKVLLESNSNKKREEEEEKGRKFGNELYKPLVCPSDKIQFSTPSTERRRGSWWLVASVGSAHGCLAPRQKQHFERGWQRKAAQKGGWCMLPGEQKERGLKGEYTLYITLWVARISRPRPTSKQHRKLLTHQ